MLQRVAINIRPVEEVKVNPDTLRDNIYKPTNRTETSIIMAAGKEGTTVMWRRFLKGKGKGALSFKEEVGF